MARTVCAASADLLIIAGDVASGALSTIRDTLALFADFPGKRVFVPGNHDVWEQKPPRNTWRRYRHELAQTVRSGGFHYLDGGPLIMGQWAVVGCMGWYDYSFRQTAPPGAQARIIPVPAARFGEIATALPQREAIAWEQLTPDDYRLKAAWWDDAGTMKGLVWNDGLFVDWGRSDEMMAAWSAEVLRSQVRSLPPTVTSVIAVTHFVPFAELLSDSDTMPRAYARAFAGSTLLGEAIRGIPGIRLAGCGHWHNARVTSANGLPVANASLGEGRRGLLQLEIPASGDWREM